MVGKMVNKFEFEWEDSSGDEHIFFRDFEESIFEEELSEVPLPNMYNIMILKDQSIPEEFLLFVLKNVFHISDEFARTIISDINDTGMSSCGTFTRDAAETKMMQVNDVSNEHDYQVQCVMQRKSKYAI